MNRKLKYCSIFLIFTALLIAAGGIATAADVDSDYTEISDNIETPTVSDDTESIAQTTDNNIESQTIEEVDRTTDTYTTATSEENKLVKDDKNLKTGVSTGTLTLTPNSGYPGDTIAVRLTGGATSFGGNGESHIFVVKLNGTTIINTKIYPTIGRRVAILL